MKKYDVSLALASKKSIDKLNLPDRLEEQISIDQLEIDVTHGPSSTLSRWFARQRKISAKTVFTVTEIYNQVNLIHQRMRAHAYPGDKRVCAMTVHQAKNREFDSVIVLWPFQIQGSQERHRRLLYAAITRAKKQALVIVQDPKADRLSAPPFAPG